MLNILSQPAAESCSNINDRQCDPGVIAVRHLYISDGHNFFGHHGEPPGGHQIREVSEIECVAARGIRGDRFFDFRENYKGQITFFAQEVFEALCAELDLQKQSPSALRRNVITRGHDLNTLVGREFKIQDVWFFGVEECRPCHWMDHAFAPGAEQFLKDRGGLRAKILSDGKLRVNAP